MIPWWALLLVLVGAVVGALVASLVGRRQRRSNIGSGMAAEMLRQRDVELLRANGLPIPRDYAAPVGPPPVEGSPELHRGPRLP